MSYVYRTTPDDDADDDAEDDRPPTPPVGITHLQEGASA